jgi:hypothetical protein
VLPIFRTECAALAGISNSSPRMINAAANLKFDGPINDHDEVVHVVREILPMARRISPKTANEKINPKS